MDIILESICTSLDGLELTFCTVPGLHKEINLILFFKIFMVLVQATCDCWSARLLCSLQDSSKSLDRVNIMSFWKIMSSSHLHLDKKVRNKFWQAMWEPEATTALAMLHWAKLAKSCLTWKKRLGIREKGVSIPVSTRSKGYQLGMSSTPRRSQRDLMLFVVLWGFFSSENRFFWETTCVNHDNLSFIFQEKFLFILPYAKFMVHLPGAIYLTPMYVFRTWLIHDMWNNLV